MPMRLFFTQLIVSGRKQLAIMAEEKSPSRISLRLFATSRSEMRISVKNNADAIIFHTAICVAGTTNSIYRRAKSEIWLAIPPARCACGMEIL